MWSRYASTWLVSLICFIGVLTTPAMAAPHASCSFASYVRGDLDGQPGYWIDFELKIPEGTSLSDKYDVIIDFIDFWLVTRESAIRQDPATLAASLGLNLSSDDAPHLVRDLLRFNGGEVVLEVTSVFESLADQNLILLSHDTSIHYRQFLALPSPDRRALGTGELMPQLPETDRAQRELAVNGAGIGPPAPVSASPQAQTIAAGATSKADSAMLSMGNSAAASEARQNQALQMNSHNLLAAVLSYRSELGELPQDLDTLVDAGHSLIALKSPVDQGAQWQVSDSRDRGGIAYERTSPSSGVLILTLLDGGIRRLQVDTPPIQPGVASYGILGDKREEYTTKAQEVRRYAFQIAKLLELFYNENGYLPSTLSQMELQGFAFIGFSNPYVTGESAHQLANLSEPSPGDYYYYRISSNEFLLTAFGPDAQRLIFIRQPVASN
ncbi:MAG: hypothetical protein ABI743_08180 [bacterium]